MKKCIRASFVLLLFVVTKSYTQPFRIDEPFPARPEIRGNLSVFHYGFDRSYMVITNEHADEPAVRISPSYIQYPYQSRKILLYGPTLGFTITANGNSSDFPIRSRTVGGIRSVMDSVFKGITEAHLANKKSRPLSKAEADSIVGNERKFDLADLQVRITKNDTIKRNWINISDLGTLRHPDGIAKGNFIVYFGYLEINDHVVITFRNKKDTSLIRFEFERAGPHLQPFLAIFQRDTTSISYVNFVKKVLEKNLNTKPTLHEFYRYWPAGKDFWGIKIKRERIYSDTKLAFFFRKPDPDHPDASLEYLLAAGPVKDSVWQTTGHTLILSDFKSGADYTLLVRYKAAPHKIQTYTFHTLPKWYQTIKYKYIIGGIILFIVFTLLLLLYRIRLTKEKKKNAYLQYGLKSIRSQLNPHFIFNALSSIQGLINKNDIPGANHYLTEFSSLLRESLRNNDKELVPLDTELKILETYLRLEQLRFHFQYTIAVDETIDKNAVDIPALLLQPLIENAIKHGVAGLQEKGLVTISFNTTNKDLLVSITDNGNGFTENAATNGLGLKLTKDRIRLLNQSFKKQPIQLSIESSDSNGTTVHLAFENWL